MTSKKRCSWFRTWNLVLNTSARRLLLPAVADSQGRSTETTCYLLVFCQLLCREDLSYTLFSTHMNDQNNCQSQYFPRRPHTNLSQSESCNVEVRCEVETRLTAVRIFLWEISNQEHFRQVSISIYTTDSCIMVFMLEKISSVTKMN